MAAVVQQMIDYFCGIIRQLAGCTLLQSTVKKHFVWFPWALRSVMLNESLRLCGGANQRFILTGDVTLGSTWPYKLNVVSYCTVMKKINLHTVQQQHQQQRKINEYDLIRKFRTKKRENPHNFLIRSIHFSGRATFTKQKSSHSMFVKWYSCPQ